MSEESYGITEIPTFTAYCTDGCGGIITEGWSSRTFMDRGQAERALKDHRKDRH